MKNNPLKAIYNKQPSRRNLMTIGKPTFSKTGIVQRFTVASRKKVGKDPAFQMKISVRAIKKNGKIVDYKAYTAGRPFSKIKFNVPAKAAKKPGNCWGLDPAYLSQLKK